MEKEKIQILIAQLIAEYHQLITKTIEDSIERNVAKIFEAKAKEEANKKPEDRYIRVGEAAELLSRSTSTIYKYTAQGILKPYRLKGIRGQWLSYNEVLAAVQTYQFRYKAVE